MEKQKRKAKRVSHETKTRRAIFIFSRQFALANLYQPEVLRTAVLMENKVERDETIYEYYEKLVSYSINVGYC